MLAQGRVPNLASRVLALSVRRLSGDMQARFGHPVLLAETMVDPSRHRGTLLSGGGVDAGGRDTGLRPVRSPEAAGSNMNRGMRR